MVLPSAKVSFDKHAPGRRRGLGIGSGRLEVAERTRTQDLWQEQEGTGPPRPQIRHIQIPRLGIQHLAERVDDVDLDATGLDVEPRAVVVSL